eukprot:CAMPEP_0174885146 /NCGR_PEP_ID=MMETSP0167-20121228/512_1 /TAXON_ID=38298 /ORGANISM="Rhodella maculata, Strain CCMP736" /LENGTH=159 /DNA_ID=CAMNT_0016120661 /DNA_START=251 /DNA_END=730 /DNA_ORIENTATION=+
MPPALRRDDVEARLDTRAREHLRRQEVQKSRHSLDAAARGPVSRALLQQRGARRRSELDALARPRLARGLARGVGLPDPGHQRAVPRVTGHEIHVWGYSVHAELSPRDEHVVDGAQGCGQRLPAEKMHHFADEDAAHTTRRKLTQGSDRQLVRQTPGKR